MTANQSNNSPFLFYSTPSWLLLNITWWLILNYICYIWTKYFFFLETPLHCWVKNDSICFHIIINILTIKVIIYIQKETPVSGSLFKLSFKSQSTTLLKKRPCELCKIYKNIFSYRTSPVDASPYFKLRYGWEEIRINKIRKKSS